MIKQLLKSFSTKSDQTPFNQLIGRHSFIQLEGFFFVKASQSVTLNLIDVNDESPVFDSPSYQILLPEVRES